jgi:hypothetical protein
MGQRLEEVPQALTLEKQLHCRTALALRLHNKPHHQCENLCNCFSYEQLLRVGASGARLSQDQRDTIDQLIGIKTNANL